MSMDELYRNYTDGKITRGGFIRRLVAFGISLPVAAAYAAALDPGTAHAVGAGTVGKYPDLYLDLYYGPF
jgi:hypothetical protein